MEEVEEADVPRIAVGFMAARPPSPLPCRVGVMVVVEPSKPLAPPGGSPPSIDATTAAAVSAMTRTISSLIPKHDLSAPSTSSTSISACRLSSRLRIPEAKMRLKYGDVAYGSIEDTARSAATTDGRCAVVSSPREKEGEEEEGGGRVEVCSIRVVVLPSPPSER